MKYITRQPVNDPSVAAAHTATMRDLCCGHHPDDEEVGDLGQREERRIEEGDEEQAGCTQCEREALDPGDDISPIE